MNDTKKELLDLEQRQWKANREADAEFYRRYCTDDFIIVSRFGVLTKAQVLAQFEKGNINPFLRTDMEDPRVLVTGQDSALLTYKETIEASIDAEGGKTRTFSIYATTVYRRTSDGWRFVFTSKPRCDASSPARWSPHESADPDQGAQPPPPLPSSATRRGTVCVVPAESAEQASALDEPAPTAPVGHEHGR